MGLYPNERAITIDGEAVSFPGLKDGKFTIGNPENPEEKPSFIDPETINLILDNIEALISSAGSSPNNTATDQVKNAVAALIKEHTDLTTAHGAVSAATASRMVVRDSNGRAQFANPSASADAATKSYVDSQISGHDSQHDDRFVRPSGSGFADGEIGLFADATGRLIKTANMTLSASGTMGSSASVVPSEARIKAYLDALETSIKNAVWPVGSSYVQLPGASAPGSLGLPGTWTALFENEGITFRTPGGNALAFGSGIQEDQFQGFIVELLCQTLGYTGEATGRTGADSITFRGTTANSQTGYYSKTGISGENYMGDFVSDDVNGTPRVGSETRMRNRTFRVWKRTA
ncbi:hypothetical protein [Sediminispirochaeta bajacaliforniensis]|uniref:hypothetical protein n=1 Tax=Sediminispirochaeta bajacaliforniensis TaxID=148 RepID=UPI0003750F63|nr:hypothetical protein [Sediminispirochaeta bajacaliforniensis]